MFVFMYGNMYQYQKTRYKLEMKCQLRKIQKKRNTF